MRNNFKIMLKRKISLIFILFGSINFIFAQDIPQHISYSRIYDFIDEMANEGWIELNSVVKPYSRTFISDKLIQINSSIEKLNKRQQSEVRFFLEEYALEQNRLPEFDFSLSEGETHRLDGIPPIFTYNDSLLRARVQPILGMHIYSNSQGQIYHRWFGADFQAMLGKNVSVYGSLRDNSFEASKSNLNPRLSSPHYLTQFNGYEYKEPNDFSDSRGGIKLSFKWGSIGLMKDNVVWGDSYNGSNIISGRTPSFPMINLKIKPAKWFELNYIHGWLVSNVVDSARFYVENDIKKWYRNHNKFIAANMFTFTPVSKLNISFGNSIIYAEDNVQPAYLIPIAFYKSMDHTLTKGIATENQNSQLFFNISSRNIKHVHLYSSLFFDEIKLNRFQSSVAENNPFSLKIGGKISNFPIQNISVIAEYTRTNIINYKHSISALTYASNSYNLGHYLGDNSQEIYASIIFKPIRGLDLSVYYLQAKHGNEYDYLRRSSDGNIREIISQPFMNDVIWTNETIGFKALYEVMNNTYAIVNIDLSNIQARDAVSDPIGGELRMTQQEVLNYFTPQFLRGKNTNITVGLSFGF